MLFKNDRWCRMTKTGEEYACSKLEPDLLERPRGVQFYSAINYQGKALNGKWPTGRIYDFDGSKLRPSQMTPPAIEAKASLSLGYEAQAMAIYCGDLFVGHWPKGEVWRWDHREKRWHYFKRFFTPVEGEPFIPYSDRTDDGLNPALFGQRITAPIPYRDALYVVTSNLSGWRNGIRTSRVLSEDKAREYGAIHRIEREGCTSSYMKLDQIQPTE